MRVAVIMTSWDDAEDERAPVETDAKNINDMLFDWLMDGNQAVVHWMSDEKYQALYAYISQIADHSVDPE